MTLVVEDGTGKTNAESYASVAQADTRLAALGMTVWASNTTTTEREQALRRATAFMEQAFRTDWVGARLLRDQALSWPRYGAEADGFVLDSISVPTDIVNACIDLAFKAASGDLNADLTRAVLREKVGPIETEYAPNSPQATRYVSIEMALRPYLRGSRVMARLVRS